MATEFILPRKNLSEEMTGVVSTVTDSWFVLTLYFVEDIIAWWSMNLADSQNDFSYFRVIPASLGALHWRSDHSGGMLIAVMNSL